ncbi:efflux RND transporter periplasmic adaptor subunit [Novosphingobium sp. G106]|uniref:efflux RND transporter periplasmic adaptor subunit n=1 Tax=Novosphingobium sp. G106 TaxID=2849500 RepID=UPI001C2D21BB|nr:efflux RND transporter periplasmic adaptor subunit [Novosphingobium sp. G106]MBV1692624.1 efflux RND transporter periplasmic adaptor subunit [Novosphingobium sp. G106]
MKRALLALPIAIVLAGCGSAPPPAPTPSVLVGIAKAQRGSLPATVIAYGSVAPALGGTQTFSMAQPGQVTTLLATPGMAVRAGQQLATFATAPSAQGTYQQAASALTAARKQQAITAQLLGQQLATQDQLVQANKAVADAQATLAGLQAEGAGQAMKSIIAPFDGVVTAVAVAQGDRTQPGATILTVARSGGIVVTAGIDPADRAGVVAGQAATLKRLSGGTKLTGRVIRVGGALNAQTRLVDVDIGFPTGALLPGEAMQVTIETRQVAGWVVPHKAVVTAGGPARVFQILAGKAKAVPVHIALSSDQGDVVEGNLDPARPLIVAGAYQVNDGDAVRRGN